MVCEICVSNEDFQTEGYENKLRKTVSEDGIPIESTEWLLQQALNQGRNYHDFWKPYREYYRGKDTWKGYVNDQFRGIKHPPTPEQKNCIRLLLELDWWSTIPLTWLQPADSIMLDTAFELGKPAKLLETALERSPHLQHVIDRLPKPYDLSSCGIEIVQYYQDDENKDRKELARYLLHNRDTSKPMPTQVTEYLQRVLRGYREYEALKPDIPLFVGAKTNE